MRRWIPLVFVVAAAFVPTPATADAAGGAAMFAFTNELPRAFELRRVRVWVDGALRHDGAGPFAMPLLQGTHDLSLAAEYQVKDPFFSYMRGYRIALRSAERVEVHLADAVVTASAIPAGGVTTPMARRAQIVWR